MKCEKNGCGKVRYTSETTAQLACIKVALGGDASLSWYYSRACGCWHLTSTANKGNTGKRVKWVEGFSSEPRDGRPAAA